MSLIHTPICNFGEKANDFTLSSTDEKKVSLKDIRGSNGTLIMFICNHCPYVKAVTKDIVEDCNELKKIGHQLGEPGAYRRAAKCIENFIN